jgi:hypothetical protein
VQEIPVAWGHVGDARINPVVDGAKMFQEMLRVRWYSITGEYDGTRPASGGRGASVPLPGKQHKEKRA